jgi:hypothetical protein
MTYRRPAPASRSPPRNFKVNYIEEPPLNTADVNFINNLVPKIGRKCTTAEDIQLELSMELCKYLQKSVGVSVTEKQEGVSESSETHLVPITFKFTMNEFLYKIWIHEDPVELTTNTDFSEKREKAMQQRQSPKKTTQPRRY